MAHFSEDPLLTRAFLSGGDVHKATAAELFNVSVELVTKEQRGAAKTVNFATIYGQREFSLGQQLGISTGEAKKFIAAYFEKYAGVRAFIDRTLAEARRDGYVRTLFGRIRPLPDIMADPIAFIPAHPHPQNYVEAWQAAPFGAFLRNTVIITVVSLLGDVASSAVVEGGIQDIGSVSILAFRDPDGNRLMVCQRNG